MVRDTGFIWWQAGMLAALAEAALQRERYDEATIRARDQLSLSSQVTDRQSAVYALAYLARVAAEGGDLYQAGVLWGSIEAEKSRAPVGGWESERETYASSLLGHAGTEFDHGRQEGRRLALDQAIEFALGDSAHEDVGDRDRTRSSNNGLPPAP